MAAVYHELIRYIDTHIREEITVAQLAELTGYSAHHIYKIFKAYSPYPVMEYIRRKRMCNAAHDMYTGRRLYDIALDYGFETPAGFYKAFKAVFGCAPSEHRNKIEKGADMLIESIADAADLDAALVFANELFPNLTFVFGGGGEEKYSRSFWLEQMEKYSELLLCARDDDEICGILLGWVDGKSVTVAADGVSERHKNSGLHEALFIEIEKRAKRLGFGGLVLGIDDGKEEFYAKMGYLGTTLIQSEKYGVDELMSFNAQYKNYEITGSGVYEGCVNQIWVDVPLMDTGMKRRFETEIGDCRVQVIVSKQI